MGDLHLFMLEHPELIWLLGFPLVISKAAPLGFEAEASLPTPRHLTRLLRSMPNSALQFLLTDSVRPIRTELAAQEPPPTPLTNPLPANTVSVGEFYWGYGSGVVATKVPDWGEFVLAELTQPFDQADVSYFFPLMADTERRLGGKPHFGAFDAALDAFYTVNGNK
jgi:hypothetical protein